MGARKRPVRVRFVREYRNSFTGLTFRQYETVTGRHDSEAVVVKPFFGGHTKTKGETRAEAVRILTARRRELEARRR